MSQLSSSFLCSQTCESSVMWLLQIKPGINKNQLNQFGYLILGVFVNVSLEKSSSQPPSDFKCLKPSLCVPMIQSVFVMPAFNFTCYLLSLFSTDEGRNCSHGLIHDPPTGLFCVQMLKHPVVNPNPGVFSSAVELLNVSECKL